MIVKDFYDNYLNGLNNGIKPLAKLYDDECEIKLVIDDCKLTKNEYFSFLINKVENLDIKNIKFDKKEIYEINGLTRILLITSYKGNENYKVVSFLEIKNDKIINNDEYWFKVLKE